MALEPSGEVELEQHDLNLPCRDPRRTDQLVDVDGAGTQRSHDPFPFGLSDVRQRRGGLVLVVGGKTVRPRKRTTQDRRQRLDDIARRGDEACALLQKIVCAGGTRI